MTTRDYCILLLLAAATVAVYAPALPGVFVYDDYPLVLENPLVTDTFRPSALLAQENGRPLTLLSFHLNYQLAGPSPGAFRSVNLGLHLLAILLLFAVLRSLGQSSVVATIAAAVFALHPLQNQAVNYIWARSMLLMGVFALAALLWRQRPAAALILAQLAIWSRAEALVLLIPLLWLNPRLVRAGVGLAAANVAALALMFARLDPGQLVWRGYDALAYWLSAPLAAGRYLELYAWPRGLALDHGAAASGWPGLALAALAVAATAVMFRKRPVIAAAFGWTALWLAPSLAVPNADAISESRIYLALAGLAVATACGLAEMGRRRPRAAVATGLLAVAMWAGVSAQRSSVWTDEVALWRESVELYPGNAHARYNLGVALTGPGRIEAAQRAFETAYLLNPGDDRTLAALGYCHHVQSDARGARWYYQEALRLNADNDYARQSLALLLGD